MKLARVSSGPTGFELRTFDCSNCDQVEQIAIHPGRNGGVGQARADTFGDIQRAGLRRDGLLTPVGESNFDVTHREFSA